MSSTPLRFLGGLGWGVRVHVHVLKKKYTIIWVVTKRTLPYNSCEDCWMNDRRVSHYLSTSIITKSWLVHSIRKNHDPQGYVPLNLTLHLLLLLVSYMHIYKQSLNTKLSLSPCIMKTMKLEVGMGEVCVPRLASVWG